MPRVTVIGTGYLGLTHAVCLADLGHDVLAIDVDEDKVARAAKGEVPFFEPGLEPLLRKNLDAGPSLHHVLCRGRRVRRRPFPVRGTPQGADGSADLRHVHSAADALARYLWAARVLSSGSRRFRSERHAAWRPGSGNEHRQATPPTSPGIRNSSGRASR